MWIVIILSHNHSHPESDSLTLNEKETFKLNNGLVFKVKVKGLDSCKSPLFYLNTKRLLRTHCTFQHFSEAFEVSLIPISGNMMYQRCMEKVDAIQRAR